MNFKLFCKLLTSLALFVVLAGCGQSDRQQPGPGDPPPSEPDAAMTLGQAYPVANNDRLVNTSPNSSRIRVIFELDETSGETYAEVILLDGHADLF